MRQIRIVLPLFLASATAFGCAQASPDSAGVPVSMVVTVQASPWFRFTRDRQRKCDRLPEPDPRESH